MPNRPLVFIHGYSASGSSFDRWREIFLERGYEPDDIHVCTYKSLTNEVTLRDLAEGMDRALRIQTGSTPTRSSTRSSTPPEYW